MAVNEIIAVALLPGLNEAVNQNLFLFPAIHQTKQPATKPSNRQYYD